MYFLVAENGIANRYSWLSLANSVQAIGLQGATGTQGTQGTSASVQGLIGSQGATGAGTQGVSGIQGIAGSQGTAGQSPSFTSVSVPASSTSTGVVGQVSADSTYIYICVATNTWRRIYSPVSASF